jgi:uncharacterized protein YndB with AHSA1/START domain
LISTLFRQKIKILHKTTITIKTTIESSLDKVWSYWISPAHITQWNFASDEWKCPSAINNLKAGGELNWRMEAKDGSMGFDFKGEYLEIKDKELICYKLADGRKVDIHFKYINDQVELSESFEAEGSNRDEQQKASWQMILENFKKNVESN